MNDVSVWRAASLSSLPGLQAAVKATATAADDVDEKARFPSEAIELVKEAKFEAPDAGANDPFSLPSGQDTRTKSADRELKTELIVRLYDDLDDGMAVVLGKLPLGAVRVTTRSTSSDAFGLSTHDCEVAHSACVGFGMERIMLGLIRSHGFEPAMADASTYESRLDRMIEISKITQEHDYPLAAEADRGASATCR